MSYAKLEAKIERGKIVPGGPERLPETGNGLLTLLPVDDRLLDQPAMPRRQRVELPLIHGDGNPTPEELDASLWGD
jgi:hypothetical protein